MKHDPKMVVCLDKCTCRLTPHVHFNAAQNKVFIFCTKCSDMFALGNSNDDALIQRNILIRIEKGLID